MIRTFLFDLGNVLLHFSHERMCGQIGELCGQSSGEIHRLLIDSGLQWDFERGSLSEDEFHRKLEEAIDDKIELAGLRWAASDIFELNESIIPVIDDLKSQGFRLVLLSNTNISHFEFVCENFDVLDRFDDFVVSYAVGALKPNAAIYESALNKIDCDSEECFYTDDIEEYVLQARTFGLQAEVYTDTPTLVGHLERRGIRLNQPI